MIGLLMILGGLALFMFGIRLLSAGMEKLAGEKIQKWLGKVTESRFRSAVFGTVATAFLQSSGLLMVTMIGLINANLMTVPQSIGIMLGQRSGRPSPPKSSPLTLVPPVFYWLSSVFSFWSFSPIMSGRSTGRF